MQDCRQCLPEPVDAKTRETSGLARAGIPGSRRLPEFHSVGGAKISKVQQPVAEWILPAKNGQQKYLRPTLSRSHVQFQSPPVNRAQNSRWALLCQLQRLNGHSWLPVCRPAIALRHLWGPGSTMQYSV